jgi:hypothetical protein
VAHRWNCSCIGGMERAWVRRHGARHGQSLVCCDSARVLSRCWSLKLWLQANGINSIQIDVICSLDPC